MKKYYEDELVKSLARQSQVHQDNIELHRELMRADYERKLKQVSDLAEAEQLVDIRFKYKQATAALAAMRTVLTGRDGKYLCSVMGKLVDAHVCPEPMHRVNSSKALNFIK